MQSAVQKPAHFPHFLFATAGIFLVVVTAYPKSLEQSVACADKTKPAHAQCIAQLGKNGATPQR